MSHLISMPKLNLMNEIVFRYTAWGNSHVRMNNAHADLDHERAHGREACAAVILAVKERVIGHLPQLHHDVGQYPFWSGITDRMLFREIMLLIMRSMFSVLDLLQSHLIMMIRMIIKPAAV